MTPHLNQLYLLLIFAFVINSCSSDDTTPINKLDKPTFSIGDGIYEEAQTIEILSDEPNSIILYSLDGDFNSASEVFNSPIVLDKNGLYEISAKATKSGYEDSDVSTLSIEINIPSKPLTKIEGRSMNGAIYSVFDFIYDSEGKLVQVKEENPLSTYPVVELFNIMYSGDKIIN